MPKGHWINVFLNLAGLWITLTAFGDFTFAETVTPTELLLQPLLRRQHGAVTISQALAAGVSRQQLRTLPSKGWTHPARGVLIAPKPKDLFLAGLYAVLLVCPGAVACRQTAVRLHGLWGLRLWTPAELPQLIYPAGVKKAQRRGLVTHSGLRPGQHSIRKGLPVTDLQRTVEHMAGILGLPDLVCLLDRALQLGWRLGNRPSSRLAAAANLTDARSESPLETLLRLVLVTAGLAPEELQFRLYSPSGVCFARLDMAWPSHLLAVEADGREEHDKPKSLYTDRGRQNLIGIADWTILRFTWFDVVSRPDWVVSQVRQALSRSQAKPQG